MKFYLNSNQFIDTNLPLDISIPLSNTAENPRAWYVDLPVFEPVMTSTKNVVYRESSILPCYFQVCGLEKSAFENGLCDHPSHQNHGEKARIRMLIRDHRF